MFKILRTYVVGLLLLAPVMVGLGHAPSLAEDYFPVYSAPSNVEFKTDPDGVKLRFQVTKEAECQLPSDKQDQDVYVSLNYKTDNGEDAVRAANIYPYDGDRDRPFRNILIVGEPGVVGPFLVEVPESILPRLTAMRIWIKCDRPLLGEVYAKIGPFDLSDTASRLLALNAPGSNSLLIETVARQ